jgi:NADH dehydrogenase
VERAVVIGAGFAGLNAGRALAGRDVLVTIVDQHNFHTFQPLLYEVATAGLDPADVAYPVRTVFGKAHNVTFRHGRVTEVDTARLVVRLGDGSELAYDHLVVASGAAAAFFGVPGAAEHTRPLYTLGDARRLRNDLLRDLERVDARPADYNDGAPVFVVVGGGPTGVETAGALVELLDASVRNDRLRLDRARTRVVLVDAADRVLTAFAPKASRYAEDILRSRGVEVRLGEPVGEITPEGVRLRSGEWIAATAVVWAGGITVEGTLAATLPAKAERGGRVHVEPDLSLAGHPEIFVAGDAAAVPEGPGRDRSAPQVAQVAIQSGRHAGRQILRRIEGLPTTPFRYRDKGIMATIGRRAAVAQLPGVPVIRGSLGWLCWLGLHLLYLVGFRNRLIVLINWSWRYLDWPSGPRLIVADAETEP